ncbi:hypothetical protein V8F33_007110 [Rhypophila sp. PSN 637]
MASASSSAPSKAPANYSTDPALYIFTSLTAGSSHIVTATSRLETILRANKVPFKAVDLATDDKARMLWGRRAGKDAEGRVRKLPGLVQEGQVLGDLVEIEDWNEYGELKMHVKIYYDEFTQPSIHQKPKVPVQPPKPVHPIAAAVAAAASAPKPPPAPAPKQAEPKTTTTTLPIRSIAEEVAQKAKQVKLQGLRDKVHGKGGSADKEEAKDQDKKAEASKSAPAPSGNDGNKSSSSEGEEESSDDSSSPPSPETAGASLSTARGLQSPTSTGWKGGNTLNMIQSPTSTSWKPTDVDAPITTYHGSVVAAASAEEIAAIERAETIKEEDEEDEGEESEEESEEDSEEDSSEEEEEQPKKEDKK